MRVIESEGNKLLQSVAAMTQKSYILLPFARASSGYPPSEDLPFQEYSGEKREKSFCRKKLQNDTIYKHVSDDWKGYDAAIIESCHVRGAIKSWG